VRYAPDSFKEKLEREFRGRLRIRWSMQSGEWHIEQKIKRGMFPGTKPSKLGWDETTDAYIRHRDGYIHVMTVRTGDRMPCKRCKFELKVPYAETHFITCPACKKRGFESHFSATFMPLDDRLINELKKIDPENPHSENLAADLDRQNAQLEQRMEADGIRDAEAAFHQDYRRIVGNPTVGLSGSTKMWKKE
jgi:hypothetical protein